MKYKRTSVGGDLRLESVRFRPTINVHENSEARSPPNSGVDTARRRTEQSINRARCSATVGLWALEPFLRRVFEGYRKLGALPLV